jgi:hypothetical protein
MSKSSGFKTPDDGARQSHCPVCRGCGQDIIRDCNSCPFCNSRRYPRHLFSALQKLVDAGELAGLSVQDLIDSLNAGMSPIDLVDYIDARLGAGLD